MKAELDSINGKPVLKLVRSRGSAVSGSREVIDLPLSPEQVNTLKVYGVKYG